MGGVDLAADDNGSGSEGGDFMAISTGGLVVYKLPGLMWDVVGDGVQAMVNAASQDFIRADVLKGDWVSVKFRAEEGKDGRMVSEVGGHEDDTVVDVATHEGAMEVVVNPWFEALKPNGFAKCYGNKAQDGANLVAYGGAADLLVASS